MYKHSKQNAKSRKRVAVDTLARKSVGWTMAFSISAFQVLPVYAEALIIADGRTQTSIIDSGATTDIYTSTFSGGNAFNSFDRFSVGQMQTVNLHQPETAGALINVVRGGQTNIEGTLNAMKGGAVGGNVFIVNPDGIVVSSGGVINAGNLTMSTAQRGFADRLIGTDGVVDNSAVAQLFAGSEPLSAEGAIALYGEINARRLEMRSGARMIVDGRVNVVDTQGNETFNPAVNTNNAAQAQGVSVQGGVIRLFSGGDIELRGTARAASGENGGSIDIRAAGDIAVRDGAEISADGTLHGGTAILFADGSALLEKGARISATAVAGAGGFIEFSAIDTVTLGGTLDVSSASGAMGTVLIDPLHFVLAENLFTNGANWIIQATESITVTDRVISTRQVAIGANHATENSIGASGNLVLTAPTINLDRAQIYTHSTGGHASGLIALLARADAAGTDGIVLLSQRNAEINITDSTLLGGAIYVGAYASAGGTAGSEDTVERPGSITDALFGIGMNITEKLFDQESFGAEDFVQYANDLAGPYESDIPLSVAFLEAAATINITDSTLTSDGDWAGLTPTTAFEGTTEGRGYLTADGFAETSYEFVTTQSGVANYLGSLAAAFDPATQGIYIQSHAQTDVTIDAGDNKLNLVVAVTQTDSRVNITNSDLLTNARDIAIVSTAQENMSIAVDPETYGGVTAGVVASVRGLTNQVVVNGGSINSAGDLDVVALTGLNHSLTTAVDGGKDAKFALAVAVSVGRTLTEAALGGEITVAADLMLAAETLYFNKNHTTTATLGVDDPAAEDEAATTDDSSSFNDSSLGFLDEFKALVLGNPEEDPADTPSDTPSDTTPPESQTQGGNTKRGFAGALAVDVVLDQNNTFATLGGSYRNLSAGEALVDLGETTVNVTGGLAVNADFRFASSVEGGSGLSREVTSTASSLSAAQKKALEEENAGKPESEQKTEEQFINEFGNGVFLNVPVTSMTGTTQAELGAALTINAAANVTAEATTSYPNARPWDDLLLTLTGYRDQVTEFVAPDTRADDSADETGEGDSNFGVPTSLKDIINLDNYLTTKTGASGGAPSASSDGSGDASDSTEKADQELAIGITVNYFNTSNTTRAVIRDGANVTTVGAVAVNARAEGFFYHRANDVILPSLGVEGANNAIGGAINVARTANVVEALVEGAASLNAGSISLDATNDVQSVIAVYAGGNAQKIAINAAVGAIILENRTVARISDAATIEADNALTLNANDASAAWNAAGAASVSGNVGVGASGTVNFLSRDTQAIIGSGDTTYAATPGTVTVGSLSLTAENSGIQISAAIAGAVVAGKKPNTASTEPPPADGETTTPPPATEEDEDDDMIIPSWLFSDDENEALNAQNNVEVPNDDATAPTGGDTAPTDGEEEKKSSGWAISASAALNLLLTNNVTSGVQTAGTVTIITDGGANGPLTITAKNTGLGLALGGAISASTDAQNENNALAGGFAVTVDSRDTIAYLRGATVVASDIALTADDTSYVISIAVGGAGTSKGDVALAGSVAVNVVTGVGDAMSQTAVQVEDASLTADTIVLTATDNATIVGAGGAVAINLDKAGAAGVGLGVSVNVVDREVAATITGDSSLTSDSVAISATMRAALYGFAISAGVGKTGIAGSVTVNTVSTSARAGIIGTDEDERIAVNTNSLSVAANENAAIWSLAGAIAGGFKTAAGGALTINVITADTEAVVAFADVQQRGGMPVPETEEPFAINSTLGLVEVHAISSSQIGTLAAAGSGGQENAVGLGMSGNAIIASTVARIDDSSVYYAEAVDVLAHSDRTIRSLGGAAAFAGRSAVGGAVTVNVIDGNQTLASLDRSSIITTTGDIKARADATSLIESVAVALGASGKDAVSGSVTVNITTGETEVSASQTTLVSGGAITLEAKDQSDIRSLAGGAAFGGTVGVGAAISANVIAHETRTLVSDSTLQTDDRAISLTAENAAKIDTIAVSMGATAGSTAFAGSVAVAYIGNTAVVDAEDVVIAAGLGEISLSALKTSKISAITGAAAGSGGGGAIGAGITVAIIHDTVSARLDTDRAISGGDLAITATNRASIDAIAASAGVSGDTGGAGSFVFAMIGKAPSEDAATTPQMDGLADDEVDPISGAQTETEAERDGAFDLVTGQSASMLDRMGSERPTTGTEEPEFALDNRDLTYAGLELRGAGTLDVGAITVNAQELAVGGKAVNDNDPAELRETANLRSLAGAIGGGGTGGAGVAFTVNLLFGETIAEVILPSGADVSMDSDLTVSATQDGVIQTVAASAGGGGTAGISGSVTVNVMNRALRAGIYGGEDLASVKTGGGDVSVVVTQGGLIQSLAGAVGAGGTAGVGVAVGVNVMADRALAEAVRVRIDTSVPAPAEGEDPVDMTAGDVSVTANQTLGLYGVGVAVAGGGTVGVSGSFAFNINQAEMSARLDQSDVQANAVDVRAIGNADVFSLAGSVAISGTASVGLGAAINLSSMTVLTDIDASRIIARGPVRIEAVSGTHLSGNAISGAASGTVSVTGSVVTNVSTNDIAVRVRNTTGRDVDFDNDLDGASLPDEAGAVLLGSEILTDGTVLIRAEGRNTISLLGGGGETGDTAATETESDGVPTVNVSLSVGGVAGVGGTVSVNKTANTVLAAVDTGARVTGLGNSTADSAALGTVRGVAVEANAETVISVVSVNASGGLYAGVAGVFGFNIADDDAQVRIGNGTTSGSGAINAVSADEDGNLIQPHAQQNTYLSAQVRNDLTQFNLAVGVGIAGVGLASGTTLVTSKAEVLVDRGQVYAANLVDINATADTTVMSIAAGAGGGAVGVGGSVGVNILSADALVTLRAADIGAGIFGDGTPEDGDTDRNSFERTGGSIEIAADVISRTIAATGAVAGGGAAIAAGIQVNKFNSVARISVLDLESETVGEYDITRLDAGNDVALDASTTLDNVTATVGGAIGTGFAIAGSINVNLAEATTEVVVANNQTVDAGRDLRMTATENVDLRNASGAVAIDVSGGGIGIGAALDLAIFSSKTNVTVGDNVQLNVGRDLTLEAEANRRIASTVIVGGVGGTLGASIALSVVQMGQAVVLGDSAGEEAAQSNRDELLSEVQKDLDGDQTTGKDADEAASANSIEAITERGSGSDIRNEIVAARQNVDVTGQATRPDDIGVNIGANARVRVGRDVTINSSAAVSVSQLGGSVGAGAVGVSAGILVANVGVSSTIGIGAGTLIAADGDVSLLAETKPLDSETLKMRSYSVAAGVVAVGAGIAVGRTSSAATISIAEGVNIEGDTQGSADSVSMRASRSDVIDAQVLNVSAGFAGVGVVVVDAKNTGRTAITMAGTSDGKVILRAGDIALNVLDSTRTLASGFGAAGGIGGAVNGVVIVGANTGQVALSLDHAELRATGNVVLSSVAEGQASATATGVAVSGGLSVGVSIARAVNGITMSTNITNGALIGNTISVDTVLRAAAGRDNATATASSASGGILAGNGSEARAFLNYTIDTTLSGFFFAADSLTINSSSSAARGVADVRGIAGGVVAVGAVIAQVGQSEGQTSSVNTRVLSGIFDSADITMRNVSGATFDLNTVAGSGGLAAGSASSGTTEVRATSLTDIGTQGGVTIRAVRLLDMATGHDGTLRSEMNNLNATLVGVSGVVSSTSYNSTADTRLRDNVEISASELDLRTTQSIERARATGNNGFNIRSGSGGALDVAAMVSTVTLDAQTNTTIDTGAKLTQLLLNPLNEPETFKIGASSNLDLTDRVLLDAGGAIAVPIGRSTVNVTRDDTAVNIGDSDIWAEGVLLVYSGSDVDILAEVDANSYGLAGAATGSTDAIYNGTNIIDIASGALIEGMRDIELRAGQIGRRTQVVNVFAETRLFNKTAIPIPTDPRADAVATTTSRVFVGEGAEVKAVQDVYINAIGGTRSIVGYGRGKDLWREVAAEIANALGGLVGAPPVSLDIKSGTSLDNANNGIIVNGYVRAGSRNSQRLLLNQDNLIDTNNFPDLQEWEYEDIDWEVIEGFGVAGDLQERIDELEDYIEAWKDNSGAMEAVAAWRAERDRLNIQVVSAGDATVDLIDVGAIRATGGSIFLQADYVHGSSSGTLQAPGYAIIDILVTSDAFLRTDRLTIPARSGGRVTFNGSEVASGAEIFAIAARGSSADYVYQVISDGSSEETPVPLIRVQSTGTAPLNSNDPAGTIIVNGDIENLRGTAQVITQEGDIDVRADVSALTIKMEATNGNFIQGYKPGFTEVAGTPAVQVVTMREGLPVVTLEGQYGLYFDAIQDLFEPVVRILPQGDQIVKRLALPVISNDGGIRAGKNVFIAADKLNINGLIQAGRGAYSVVIDEENPGDLWNEIVAEHGATGSGRVLIHNPAERDDGDVVRSAFITSDVPVYWNYDDGRIEVSRMIVQGGQVDLVGNILSTGNGRIEALDGFGEVTLDSNTMLSIALTRIDTGGSDVGVAGVVRITDTAKTVAGTARFLTTEFRRVGGAVSVYNNTTEREEFLFDDDTVLNGEGDRPTRLVPDNLVTTFAAGSRAATYAPVANRDLILLTGEKIVTTFNMLEKELVVIRIRGVSRKVSVQSVSQTSERTQLGPAPTFGSIPYLGASLSGAAYDYAFVGTQLVNTTALDTPKVETYNSVKWWKLGSGWINRTFDRVQTTEQLYEHRLNASKTIDIFFGGSDVGALNLQTAGDLFFSDTVINAFGESVVASSAGSVRTDSAEVELNTANLSITAGGGSITGQGDAFNLNQFDGATLRLTARDNIFVREIIGDMNLVSAVSTAPSAGGVSSASSGNIRLIAQGDLLHVAGEGLVQGANITLESIAGSVGGGETAPVRIDLVGGRLNAEASRDIAIREVAGDMGVDTVLAKGGSVFLEAISGSIVDRNDIEERDIRNEQELTALYTEGLGMNGDGLAEREVEQMEALTAQRNRMFDEYWAARDAASGEQVAFTLDAEIRNNLEAATNAELVAAYVAEREALYAEWNAQDTRNNDDALIGLDVEFAEIFNGAGWTNDELTLSIEAGLVRQTGDTSTRIEDPNVIASGNITLRASGSIGELTPDYVIDTTNPLTAEDLLVLSAADRLDLVDEDGNLLRDEDGNIRIVQREDLNFAFTGIDDDGVPLGNLTIVADGREIFVGAKTPAAIRQVDGTGDVQILIDGAITDASEGDTPAVRGSALVLESGNEASIGTEEKPLSIEIVNDGSLNARSGQNVFITAPFGGIPIEALFAGQTASIMASGAITDNVGSTLPRIVARNIILDAGSIGTSSNMLGIELSDEEDGRIILTTRTGDIYLDVVSEMNLASADLSFGGRIEARKAVTLYGDDTLSFGLGSVLRLDTQLGIVRTSASGRDVTGGTLELFSGGDVGSGDLDRLTTELEFLSFTGLDEQSTALWIDEATSIRVDAVTQNANAASVTDIEAGGDISLGQATSLSRTRLAAGGSITEGIIIAEETTLEAGVNIGNLARFEAQTGLFRAQTTDGNADILLRDRATDVDFIAIGGAGNLDLNSTNAPVRLMANGDAFGFGTGSSDGAGIVTMGGYMTLSLTSLQARADIASNGGAIAADILGDMSQTDGSRLMSEVGTIAIDVGGDFDIASIWTTNATDDALRLTVDGTLRKSGTTHVDIDASTTGALSVLRLGAMAPAGPVGLETDIDRLDAIVSQGDIHFNDAGRMTVEQVLAENGNVDIFVDGELVVRNARSLSSGQSHVVLSALGNIRSDAAVLEGDIVSLFSFGGQITGETQDFFQGDVQTGNDLRLLADTDIRYRETSGDLISAFMLAGNGGVSGDLEVDVVDGELIVGLLGAVGTINLRAADVKVAMIGRASIDIADETGLQLVRPDYYGTYEARSPRELNVTAYRSGGGIELGLANVRETVGLYADNIDGRLYDAEPASDLVLNMTNPDGDFVSQVYLRVVGDGAPYVFADPVEPFSVEKADDLYNEIVDLVANRLVAQRGTLFLQDSMIGTGEVIHAGSYFVGTDNRIDGDVYFRQRSFDLYAHTIFRFLDTEADAQVLTVEDGKIGFTILNELILTTADVLVLNRKLAGVSLDGGQGFTADVGVETEILGGSFIRGTAQGGVLDGVGRALGVLLIEGEEEEGETIGSEEDGQPVMMDPALIEHLLRASL